MGRCLKPFDFTANDAVDEECKKTQEEAAAGVGEDDPVGSLRVGLAPRLAYEPNVGHNHGHPDYGVEGKDSGNALPVWQKGATGCWGFHRRLGVVAHADNYQEEAGGDLVAAEEDGLGPGDAEGDQLGLLLLNQTCRPTLHAVPM